MSIIKQKDIYDDSKKVFDKLQKELDATEAKTNELIAANKKLQESYRALQKTNDGTEAKKLVATTNQLTASTKKLKTALTDEERIQKKIAAASRNLRESQTKEAQTLAHLRQKTLEQNRALREQAKANLGVQKSTKGLRISLAGLGKQLIGSLGIIGGITALVGVMKDAFKIFTEFSKAGSKLAAILKTNKNGVKALTDQAKQLGSTTAFTASQIISLQTELAKLGFGISQIEAMTEGVLNLAAATGTDLAQSAELVGSTLNIFNLSASESSRVADVLAKSTTISSLSMEKLATILPTVGKTAQIAGLSLEQTAALAGTLTDRGLDASSAATSLRNIFLELSKKGITWNDAMQQINESTDKNKTAMDLFGKRAASAGVILSETAEDTDKLTIALLEANGAAQAMADTMLDNLAGDITIAKSAWEGFILSLEDGEGVMSRLLRGVVQDFTGFLGRLTDFNASSFTRQLKIIANSLLDLMEKTFLPFLGVIEKITGKSFDKFRFNVDRGTEAIGKLNTGVAKNTKTLKEENEQIIKATNSLKRNTKAVTDNNKAKGLTRGQAGLGSTINPIEGIRAINVQIEGEEAAHLTKLQGLNDASDAVKLRKAKASEIAIADARQQITEQAITSGVQLASDIFSAGQDAKIAKLNEDAEIEKAILQDQLEKGLITEAQFKAKSEEIDKKVRNESAKADKKKALFDVAIATAVGIARSIPNPVAMALAAALGAIQLATVAARPIPQFEKGEIDIKGKRHSAGGILAEIEAGESVINRLGTSNAPSTLEAINKGLVKDSDIMLAKNYNNYDKSILQLNGLINAYQDGVNQTKETNRLLSKLGIAYSNNGMINIEKANGKINRITQSKSKELELLTKLLKRNGPI